MNMFSKAYFSRQAWIILAVASLVIFTKTWDARNIVTFMELYKEALRQTCCRPVVSRSRESDGCSCIDQRSGQLANLTVDRKLKTRTECPETKNASFFPLNRSIKHCTALASFPGSGNTWTRHLIEYVSGILTGSVYNDDNLAPVFVGELAPPDHRVIAIKTHYHYNLDRLPYDNVVLLVRHPVQAIASFYNFERADSHILNANHSVFNTTAWTSHVSERTADWRDFHLSYLDKYQGGMLLLPYARLVDDFYSEVCRLGQFLNLTIPYNTLRCAHENQEGKFHRKSVFDYHEFYTQAQVDKINGVVHDVEEAMVHRFGETVANGMF